MPDQGIALDSDLTVRLPAMHDWVTVRLEQRAVAAKLAEADRPGVDAPSVPRRHRHRQRLAARIAGHLAVAALAFGVAYACLIGWIAAVVSG